jgi:hypothetical protein
VAEHYVPDLWWSSTWGVIQKRPAFAGGFVAIAPCETLGELPADAVKLEVVNGLDSRSDTEPEEL